MKSYFRKGKGSVFTGILITILVCTIASICAYLIVDSFHPRHSFPTWEKAEERKTDPRVKITFDGIDTGIYLGERVRDQVNVTLHKGKDGPYTGGDGHIIEYQFKGAWYIVYDATVYAERSRYLGEEPEISMKYLVPAGLFQTTGTYRIYVQNLGYCEFTVEIPLGSVVSDPPRETHSRNGDGVTSAPAIASVPETVP